MAMSESKRGRIGSGVSAVDATSIGMPALPVSICSDPVVFGTIMPSDFSTVTSVQISAPPSPLRQAPCHEDFGPSF